jgi:rifampicin phosphotransferase
VDSGALVASVVFPADDQVDGYWAHDRIHAPRPLSPLALDLITDTLAIGFTRAHREIGAPVDMLVRSVNSFLYTSLRPVTDPDELRRRAERYVNLPTVLDEIGSRWELEWKPWLIERVRAGRVAEYAELTNAEFEAELDRQIDHMTEQWTIHGRINFGIVAAARFIDFYQATFAPQDPAEAHQLLQGYVTMTVRTSDELWRLSRHVRSSPELVDLFSMPTPALVTRLRSPDRGSVVAEFADAFQQFLDEYGWRSDAVFDVADATWREDPSIPIDSLRGYVRLSDEHDPAAAFEASVSRREALTQAARAKLADDPESLATFDRFHEAARHNLPITEDHAFWIDQSGVANFRRFLLQLGERLVSDLCIDRADDVFFLTRAEISDALASGGDHRHRSAERRIAVAAAAASTPPRSIGHAPPPALGGPDPIVDAIVHQLGGRRPPQRHDPDATALTGHPASPGRVTGTARVVRSLADAAKLDDGDILVCEMTLPPWVPLFAIASAVVADTGGLMSHCAIVAREFGLPAVVGTQFGTTLITDGMQITVDGGAGSVTLHRS